MVQNPRWSRLWQKDRWWLFLYLFLFTLSYPNLGSCSGVCKIKFYLKYSIVSKFIKEHSITITQFGEKGQQILRKHYYMTLAENGNLYPFHLLIARNSLFCVLTLGNGRYLQREIIQYICWFCIFSLYMGLDMFIND